MTTWLFIGTVFGAVLILAFFLGRIRKFRGVDPRYVNPAEHKRRLALHAKEVSGIRSYQRGPDGGVGLT